MDIEVRHLQALVAVAEAGTFGKAAEALGYTQSAVSQQIAALERATGTPVFDRPGGPRPVRLTAAGEVLLEHARTVLATLRMAEADIDAVTTRRPGPAAGRADAERRHPDPPEPAHPLRGRATGGADRAPRGPRRRRAAGDGGAPGPRPRVLRQARRPTARSSRAACSTTRSCCSRRTRRSGATGDASRSTRSPRHPLVGNRNPSCCGQALLAFGDLEPNFVFESDDNSTIQGCVAAGLGVSLAPMLTIDLDDPTTVIVERRSSRPAADDHRVVARRPPPVGAHRRLRGGHRRDLRRRSPTGLAAERAA